MNHE
jgi:hypothetical protein